MNKEQDRKAWDLPTFKRVATTTQVLYQTLLQAVHSSSPSGVVEADTAEVLHETAKLLATVAHNKEEAGTALNELVKTVTMWSVLHSASVSTPPSAETKAPMSPIPTDMEAFEPVPWKG